MVEYEDGKTIPVKSIRVLSNELYLACEQDVSLLDAIYNLLSKAVHLILPRKEELLFWSKVINEWYEDNEAENLHCKKRSRLLQQKRRCCYSSDVAKLMFSS